MIHLLFRLGQEIFAVPAVDIERMLPLPELAQLAAAPAHLAGLMHYQGWLLPVIDLKVLLAGEPCQRLFSTRIVLVRAMDGGQLGLLVEQATEMQNLDSPQAVAPELIGGGEWLSPVLFETRQGLARRVDWRALLTPELRSLVKPGA